MITIWIRPERKVLLHVAICGWWYTVWLWGARRRRDDYRHLGNFRVEEVLFVKIFRGSNY